MNTENTTYKATSQEIHNFWLNVYLSNIRMDTSGVCKLRHTDALQRQCCLLHAELQLKENSGK